MKMYRVVHKIRIAVSCTHLVVYDLTQKLLFSLICYGYEAYTLGLYLMKEAFTNEHQYTNRARDFAVLSHEPRPLVFIGGAFLLESVVRYYIH